MNNWELFVSDDPTTHPMSGEIIVAIMDHLEHGWCIRMGCYVPDLHMIGMPCAEEFILHNWARVEDHHLPTAGKPLYFVEDIAASDPCPF